MPVLAKGRQPEGEISSDGGGRGGEIFIAEFVATARARSGPRVWNTQKISIFQLVGGDFSRAAKMVSKNFGPRVDRPEGSPYISATDDDAADAAGAEPVSS